MKDQKARFHSGGSRNNKDSAVKNIIITETEWCVSRRCQPQKVAGKLSRRWKKKPSRVLSSKRVTKGWFLRVEMQLLKTCVEKIGQGLESWYVLLVPCSDHLLSTATPLFDLAYKLGPLEFSYPLNPATKSKSHHRFISLFSTQPTIQYGSKGAELAGKFKFSLEAARAYKVSLLTFNN